MSYVYTQRGLFGPLGQSLTGEGAVSQNVGKMAENHKTTQRHLMLLFFGGTVVREGDVCCELVTIGVADLGGSPITTRFCDSCFRA